MSSAILQRASQSMWKLAEHVLLAYSFIKGGTQSERDVSGKEAGQV